MGNQVMMQCQICGDTQGPFEIEEHNNRCKLVCEDCGKEIKKERKKNETANVRNKGYARRISRTNRRS